MDPGFDRLTLGKLYLQEEVGESWETNEDEKNHEKRIPLRKLFSKKKKHEKKEYN